MTDAIFGFFLKNFLCTSQLKAIQNLGTIIIVVF